MVLVLRGTPGARVHCWHGGDSRYPRAASQTHVVARHGLPRPPGCFQERYTQRKCTVSAACLPKVVKGPPTQALKRWICGDARPGREVRTRGKTFMYIPSIAKDRRIGEAAADGSAISLYCVMSVSYDTPRAERPLGEEALHKCVDPRHTGTLGELYSSHLAASPASI